MGDTAEDSQGMMTCPNGYQAASELTSDDWCADNCQDGCSPANQALCKCAVDMPCGLLYFVHIPKTGGSTIYNRLNHLGWESNRLYWGDGENNHTAEWVADKHAWKSSQAWKWVQQKLDSEQRPKMILEAHHGAPGLHYMVAHELKDIACRLKSRGCQVRVITMLREPVERVISSLIFNHLGMPEDQKAINMLRYFAEEQSRYLVSGHFKQWPDAWYKIPPPGFVDKVLAKKVQEALSYVHIVGNTKRLDVFADKVASMLGGEDTPLDALPDLNVTPDYNVTPEKLKVLSGQDLSDTLKNALLRATQTDRNIYRSWFGNSTERIHTFAKPHTVRSLSEDCV